jgi:hypothetical protein
LGQLEAAGGGGDVHFLKVVEEENLTVFGGQGIDGFVDGDLFAVPLEGGLSAAAWVVGLEDFVEGKADGWDAAELGAVEVGSEGEEPGGEGRLLPPGGEVAEGAEEGLLGKVFSAAAVAGEAIGEVDEGRLPAADNGLEGGGVAGEDEGNVALVVGRIQGEASPINSVTGVGMFRLRFFWVVEMGRFFERK